MNSVWSDLCKNVFQGYLKEPDEKKTILRIHESRLDCLILECRLDKASSLWFFRCLRFLILRCGTRSTRLTINCANWLELVDC